LKVRYTERAASQLAAILDYIEARSPQGAERVLDRIEDALTMIAAHPQSGRATNRLGFRRVVVRPYPYTILYQPTEREIVIHGVRHTARR